MGEGGVRCGGGGVRCEGGMRCGEGGMRCGEGGRDGLQGTGLGMFHSVKSDGVL